MFQPNPLFDTDGYKIGHKAMLAPGTDFLYATWIPRSLKYMPSGINRVISFGHQLVWREINDLFTEHFFNKSLADTEQFSKDMEEYLGIPFNGDHFRALHNLGYLPVCVKALPEGIETEANIPHMTFINTVKGFAWLTLYLETMVSNLAWKAPTAATLALRFKKVATEWVMKTDSEQAFLIPFLCHDFSARGLTGRWDKIAVGLGHATSFRGSDTLMAIPAARYYYGETEVAVNSVNASEHSVTCTGIFYYENMLRNVVEGKDTHAGRSFTVLGYIEDYYAFDAPSEGSVKEPDYLAIAEWLNLRDWLRKFPKGILSIVSDTFNLWKLITYILPRLKDEILAREGKLVIRPDSGNPVDIVCGYVIPSYMGENSTSLDYYNHMRNGIDGKGQKDNIHEFKGVIELLWDIFGGTVSKEGYKVLDSHIGAIYGDSINLERQGQIYQRLADKGFAATNIVLGVGSFTYEYMTRDNMGFAAKGAWFESEGKGYDIYKDPITDDGTKKSLKGKVAIHYNQDIDEFEVKTQCSDAQEKEGLLQLIYEDGEFFNQTTLTEIREKLS